jgi:hypothetical protein
MGTPIFFFPENLINSLCVTLKPTMTSNNFIYTHTHTHTHTYMDMDIYGFNLNKRRILDKILYEADSSDIPWKLLVIFIALLLSYNSNMKNNIFWGGAVLVLW